MINEFTQQILRLEREYNALHKDNQQLVKALQELEHAVNKNVSGIKVDLGEWLRLIHQAREALGDRTTA